MDDVVAVLDSHMLLFLAGVVAVYLPVLGWCWWDKRKNAPPDPYNEPWS